MNDSNIPSFLKTLLWSYDVSKMDLLRDEKTVVVNTINYGDLEAWRWLSKHYGKDRIREILSTVSITEFRKPVLKLASLLFNVNSFNYAQRGT